MVKQGNLSCDFVSTYQTIATHLAIKLRSLKPKLVEVYERVKKEYPDFLDKVLHPQEMDPLRKLSKTVWTSDCCNPAMATRKEFNVKVSGTHGKMDCHQHMRNTSFCNGTKKTLSKDLSSLLRNSLDKIDHQI